MPKKSKHDLAVLKAAKKLGVSPDKIVCELVKGKGKKYECRPRGVMPPEVKDTDAGDEE